MISRAHRFHGHTSLPRVYRQAQTVRAGQLSLKYVASQQSSYRAAIVVSRKVHKSAVVRNRLRRRIYAILESYELHLKPYDLIFSVFDDQLNKLTPTQLDRLIADLLKKAGALANSTP